jgi:hypothetical protein
VDESKSQALVSQRPDAVMQSGRVTVAVKAPKESLLNDYQRLTNEFENLLTQLEEQGSPPVENAQGERATAGGQLEQCGSPMKWSPHPDGSESGTTRSNAGLEQSAFDEDDGSEDKVMSSDVYPTAPVPPLEEEDDADSVFKCSKCSYSFPTKNQSKKRCSECKWCSKEKDAGKKFVWCTKCSREVPSEAFVLQTPFCSSCMPKTVDQKSVLGAYKKFPQGNERYNTEQQGYPSGEIQWNRKGRRHISWRITHSGETEGQVLFHSTDWTYGGPFGFMSRYHEAKFEQPYLIRNFVFTSIEQAYQLHKASSIRRVPERWSNEWTPPLSSKQLMAIFVRQADSIRGTHITNCGETFDNSRETEPKWFERWDCLFKLTREEGLNISVDAKFKQNPQALILLMMTGDYKLFEAAPDDREGGIGFRAARAVGRELEWGENMLGKALMAARGRERLQCPAWPRTFNLGFWHELEKCHPAKNKEPLTTEELNAHNGASEKYHQAWLEGGGKVLEDRIKMLLAGREELEQIWAADTFDWSTANFSPPKVEIPV